MKKKQDDEPLTSEELLKRYLERYPMFLSDVAFIREYRQGPHAE